MSIHPSVRSFHVLLVTVTNQNQKSKNIQYLKKFRNEKKDVKNIKTKMKPLQRIID